MSTDSMSTDDAIIGLAIKAGSAPIFSASKGTIPPIAFANMVIITMERHTVSAMSHDSLSIIIIFKNTFFCYI